MFDSIHGLAPAILIGSIFNTFFQYCGLVLMVAPIVLSFRFFTHIPGTDNVEMNWVSWLFLVILFRGITLYATFVVAHLLGRFYWRNQEKLNWEV